MQNVVSTEEKIIKEFHNLGFNPEDSIRILEFGTGRYGFSKIIRKAFPNAFILGYDMGNQFITRKTMKILNELRVRDISSKFYPKAKATFDIMTFGSPTVDPGFHFGFYSQERYKKALKALDYYLKPNGFFFAVTKSSYYENKRQKNYLERNIQNISKKEKGYLLYDEVADLTKGILQDYKDFQTIIVKDEDVISQNILKPRAEILKMQLEMNIVNKEEYNKTLPIAEKVDRAIAEEGAEKGFFQIQKARKG